MAKVDKTVNQLRKIFKENDLEFIVKEHSNGIIKVNFICQCDGEHNEHDTQH